jgi:hypothetical protein
MPNVSRKLNILCIMFKVISSFIIKLFAMLYERVDTIGAIPKSNIKIVERGKIDIPNTQMHDRSLSWLVTYSV